MARTRSRLAPPAQNPSSGSDILAAIDVGTNAVRLELARVLPDGSLESLHQERDPVRPGEGLFTSGIIRQEVADRLLAALRRYGALCRRYQAHVRAVATSAVREAKNRDDIVRRAREEAGIDLEVVSGKEEARLICVGVLHGKASRVRSLCLDIGGGSTEVAFAIGEAPRDVWSVAIGAVRLTELFGASATVSRKQLKLMRHYADEAISEAIPRRIAGAPNIALGSSGTINAVVSFAAPEGTAHASLPHVERAVEALASMSLEKRRKRFDARRAEIVVAGAVILESAMKHLSLRSIIGVDRGLRDGLLIDLLRRRKLGPDDHTLSDAARAVGRRFQYDEAHSSQVATLALRLFDDLAPLHRLPAAARPYLEVAALLHDIGNAVSYHRHHKHTYYLIQHADIPGLADREREVVARIARYHRRSAPELAHAGMTDLTPTESRIVRKCATLLRIADALDRSHQQPIQRMTAVDRGPTVLVRIKSNGPADLELWDALQEAPVFRLVFGKRLVCQVERGRA